MNKMIKMIGTGLCAGLVLVGCSAGGKGGDTTCAQFNKMDSKEQKEVIAKMLKDDKGKEPSNLAITGTKLSASAFCKTLGKDSSKVKDIKTG